MNTAFEITIDDVEIVLNKMGRLELNASEVFDDLDLDEVESSALSYDDLDEQTNSAHAEIERQIRIIRPITTEFPFRFNFSLGDWSEDGHNQYDEFVFDSNKSVKKLQKAYKDSCRLTGVQFNHNENYTGLHEQDRYGSKTMIWTEYEDSQLSNEAQKILTNHGLAPYVLRYMNNGGKEDAVALVLAFVKLSLPDFEYKEGSFKKSELETIPAFNGWWNDDLNVQIGYGLYR